MTKHWLLLKMGRKFTQNKSRKSTLGVLPAKSAPCLNTVVEGCRSPVVDSNRRVGRVGRLGSVSSSCASVEEANADMVYQVVRFCSIFKFP